MSNGICLMVYNCILVDDTPNITQLLLGRTKYSKYSPEQRAEFGPYAAGTNIARSVKKYQTEFPNLRKQFDFKKEYLKQKDSSGKEVIILKTKKTRSS